MLTSEIRGVMTMALRRRREDDGATVVELQQRREKVAHLFLDVSVHGCGGNSAWHRVRRGGAVGGGHRTCRLRWSCETSTLTERGSDDPGETGGV